MSWITEGRLTNPSSGAILADTGPLAATTVNIIVVLTGTALGSVRLQHRNAANNGTVHEHFIKVPANATQEINFGALLVADDERIRVIADGMNVEDIQASLVTL